VLLGVDRISTEATSDYEVLKVLGTTEVPSSGTWREFETVGKGVLAKEVLPVL
jgi:hypothetical protein